MSIFQNSFVLIAPILLFNLLFYVSTIESPGFYVYLFGMLVYLISWVIQIKSRKKPIKSLFLFCAPAFTVAIWLAAVSLLSTSYFDIGLKGNLIYSLVCLVFVTVHTTHALIVGKKMKVSGEPIE